ncbi:GNAT family N-acetyltransferase [Nanoarchaeota archaeon]
MDTNLSPKEISDIGEYVLDLMISREQDLISEDEIMDFVDINPVAQRFYVFLNKNPNFLSQKVQIKELVEMISGEEQVYEKEYGKRPDFVLKVEDHIPVELEDQWYMEVYGRPKSNNSRIDPTLETRLVVYAKSSFDDTTYGWMTFGVSPITIRQEYIDSFYIDMMYVNPNYRGFGIGTEMMLRMIRVAPNMKKIDLHTPPVARSFYAKHGFIEVPKSSCEKEDASFIAMSYPLTNDCEIGVIEGDKFSYVKMHLEEQGVEIHDISVENEFHKPFLSRLPEDRRLKYM